MADNECDQREGTKCLAGRGYDISGPFDTLLLPYSVMGTRRGKRKMVQIKLFYVCVCTILYLAILIFVYDSVKNLLQTVLKFLTLFSISQNCFLKLCVVGTDIFL